MRRLIFVLSCLVAFNLPFPTQAAELIGVWAVASGNARVQIQRCAPPGGDAFCGYIVWLKQAANPDGTPVASVEEVRDTNNSDARLRGRKLLDLQLLSGFRVDPDDANVFIDGYAYDAEKGETYRAKLTLKGDDQLVLRGYVLMPIFGSSQTWLRFK